MVTAKPIAIATIIATAAMVMYISVGGAATTGAGDAVAAGDSCRMMFQRMMAGSYLCLQSSCAIIPICNEIRMAYYHLAIKYYVGNKKSVRRFRYFNYSSEELIAHYVQPYNNNMPFFIH